MGGHFKNPDTKGKKGGIFYWSLLSIFIVHIIYVGWAAYIVTAIDFTVPEQKGSWEPRMIQLLNTTTQILLVGMEYFAWFSPCSTTLYVTATQVMHEIKLEVANWKAMLGK